MGLPSARSSGRHRPRRRRSRCTPSISLWHSCAATLLQPKAGRLVNRIDDAVAAPPRPRQAHYRTGFLYVLQRPVRLKLLTCCVRLLNDLVGGRRIGWVPAQGKWGADFHRGIESLGREIEFACAEPSDI